MPPTGWSAPISCSTSSCSSRYEVMGCTHFHAKAGRCRSRTARLRVAAGLFEDFRKTKNSIVIPSRLLKSSSLSKEDCEATPATVYTVRVSTGYKRGSALSDYNAGVLLCLVGQNGKAILKTIGPIADSDEAADDLKHICSVVDQSAGANCDLATSPSAPWARSTPQGTTHRRFQEGHVDECVFLAPELGPLAAIYVAPQAGSWVLDEVNVSSSRTGHLDRFVCRKRLGEGSSDPAACLPPVPVGAVVYGSGESAVVLTKEQAAVVRAVGTAEYSALKGRLLATTAALAAGGSALAAAVGGADMAVPFVVGGVAGVLYQWLLQQGADSLAVQVQQQQQQQLAAAGGRQVGQGTVALRPASALFTSSSTRVAVMALLALAAIAAVQDPVSEGEAAAAMVSGVGAAPFQQLLYGLAGFFTYKLALIGVYLAPQEAAPAPAREFNRNA